MKRLLFFLPFILFLPYIAHSDTSTTGNLKLLKPTTGFIDAKRSWADKLNANFDIIDATVTSVQNKVNNGAIGVNNEGVFLGNATMLDCAGAGVDCTASGSTITLTIPGGSGLGENQVFSTNVAQGQIYGGDIAEGTIGSSHTLIMGSSNTFSAPQVFGSSVTFSSPTISIAGNQYTWQSTAPASGDSILHHRSNFVYWGGDLDTTGGGGGGGGDNLGSHVATQTLVMAGYAIMESSDINVRDGKIWVGTFTVPRAMLDISSPAFSGYPFILVSTGSEYYSRIFEVNSSSIVLGSTMTFSRGRLLVPPGSTTSPGIGFWPGPGAGFEYDLAANIMYFVNAGSRRITFQSSGINLSIANAKFDVTNNGSLSNPEFSINSGGGGLYGYSPTSTNGIGITVVGLRNDIVIDASRGLFGVGTDTRPIHGVMEISSSGRNSGGADVILLSITTGANHQTAYEFNSSSMIINVASITLAGVPYVFPTADGTNGQVLKTNSKGILTWSADNNTVGTRIFTIVIGTTAANNVDIGSTTVDGLNEALARGNQTGQTENSTGFPMQILYRDGIYTMVGATIPSNVLVYALPGSSVVWQIDQSSATIVTNYGTIDGISFSGSSNVLNSRLVDMKSNSTLSNFQLYNASKFGNAAFFTCLLCYYQSTNTVTENGFIYDFAGKQAFSSAGDNAAVTVHSSKQIKFKNIDTDNFVSANSNFSAFSVFDSSYVSFDGGDWLNVRGTFFRFSGTSHSNEIKNINLKIKGNAGLYGYIAFHVDAAGQRTSSSTVSNLNFRIEDSGSGRLIDLSPEAGGSHIYGVLIENNKVFGLDPANTYTFVRAVNARAVKTILKGNVVSSIGTFFSDTGTGSLSASMTNVFDGVQQ